MTGNGVDTVVPDKETDMAAALRVSIAASRL